MKNDTNNSSNGKKLKYKYLDKSLNNSLNKIYYSPQRRQRSFIMPRRVSIEDFSPYKTAERQCGKLRNSLVQQLITQNSILNNQIVQYRTIVLRMQKEISQKNQINILLRQTIDSDRVYYQDAIIKMKEEIKLLLAKNSLLQNQLRDISELRAKENFLANSVINEQMLSFQKQLLDILASTQAKKSDKQPQMKKRSRNVSSEQIISSFENLAKTYHTFQDFIKSIQQMYRKIQNEPQSVQLKVLWKWLKALGQQYNFFKKIKKPLAKKLGLNCQRSIEQMIERVFAQEFKIIL